MCKILFIKRCHQTRGIQPIQTRSNRNQKKPRKKFLNIKAFEDIVYSLNKKTKTEINLLCFDRK